MRLVFVLILAIFSISAFSFTDPLETMGFIYSCREPQELHDLFFKTYEDSVSDSVLFLNCVKELNYGNDNFDIRKLRKGKVSVENRMRFNARILSRILFRLGELENGEEKLLKDIQILRSLPDDPAVDEYIVLPAYMSLAKLAPFKLYAMLREGYMRAQAMAALALCRKGFTLPESRIMEQLADHVPNPHLPLLSYSSNTIFKNSLLEAEMIRLAGKPDWERCFRQRELLNALASYPQGRRIMRELAGLMDFDFLEIDGVYFGTLYGDKVTLPDLKKQVRRLRIIANIVNRANRAFNIRENICYVDVCPAQKGGPPAAWGHGHLLVTLEFLEKAHARVLEFVIAHEAAERHYVKGCFSSELGYTWVRAFDDNEKVLNQFKIDTRIGGRWAFGQLGHPWDGEREWLAEVGSALLLRERLRQGTEPALSAVRSLL